IWYKTGIQSLKSGAWPLSAMQLSHNSQIRKNGIVFGSIAGLLVALDEYSEADDDERRSQLENRNQKLLHHLESTSGIVAHLEQDEAGRSFSRVALRTQPAEHIHQLVEHLRSGKPSIHTRNHHLNDGYVLIDPRELHDDDVETIAARIREFADST
ncbi:MAG: hypothetical protein AAF525_18340, partial [Pseudomonadota bacterium]